MLLVMRGIEVASPFVGAEFARQDFWVVFSVKVFLVQKDRFLELPILVKEITQIYARNGIIG